MSKKIAVVGNTNLDSTIYTNNLPVPGITVTGESYFSSVGGKGANQAAAIHLLGGDVELFSLIGNDKSGTICDDYFRSIGLKTNLEIVNDSTGSAFIIVDVPTAENRILVVPGANAKLDQEIADKWFEKIKDKDILVAQLEVTKPWVLYLIEKAKKAGLTTILNPAPYSPIEEKYLSYVDFFIPNEHELESHTKNVEGSYIDKANYLLSKGVKHVIVTLGSNGSILVDKDQTLKIEPCKVDAVDTTGAGDSYIGAFSTYLSEGRSIEDSMRFANKASSITVQRKGAIVSLPKREEVK